MPARPLIAEQLVVSGERGRRLLFVERLRVAPGACVGVTGPSGAGKTTLLYALAGLLPARGSVRWGKTDILALGAGARARFRRTELGFVFQDALLFDELSPAENAAVAAAFRPRAERADIAATAKGSLSALGVPRDRRRAGTFSGGERQRIGIARALAHRPAAVLADEPTASLDRDTADRLLDDLLAKVRDGGLTLIAISHDAALLSRMDRVIALNEGRLVDPLPSAA